MNLQPSASASSARVRWTFGDLVLVALATLALAGVALLLLQLPRLLGLADLRQLLLDRPLLVAMFIGALIYGFSALATFVLIVRRGRGSWREIGFRAPPLVALLVTPLLFIGQMTALLVTNLALTSVLGEFQNPQVGALTDPRGFSWINFAAVFVVAAIIAPIVEELLFRGLLYQWLRKHGGVALAVPGSAALFAVVHFIPVLLPALFVVGIVLALAFEWSKSLWVTITLHAMQNALGVIAIFVAQAYPELLRQP